MYIVIPEINSTYMYKDYFDLNNFNRADQF